MIVAAEFDVGVQRDGIVGLRDRVQEFVQRDRRLRLEALAEIFPAEHLRDGRLRHEPDQCGVVEPVQPFGIAAHGHAVQIEDLTRLLLVGLEVRLDLLAGERRARIVAARRVADQRGRIADEQRYVVPEFDELLHLVQHDGVPQVQVAARRIDPELDSQRTPSTQPCGKLRGGLDVLAAVDEHVCRIRRRIGVHGLA